MKQLQFPSYSFRFKNSENKVAIFDEIRKKFIIVTPEEWVRQHVVQFLLQDKKYHRIMECRLYEKDCHIIKWLITSRMIKEK